MKDTPDMGDFSQKEFQAAKDMLDRAIKIVGKLADQSHDAMVHCCRNDHLDARDDFAELTGKLREAEGKLMCARAIGGRIQTGDGVITRGGST